MLMGILGKIARKRCDRIAKLLVTRVHDLVCAGKHHKTSVASHLRCYGARTPQKR